MPLNVPFTDLDAMLTPDECAAWLGVEKRYLLENPLIPRVKLGKKTIRYHVRTVIEKQTGTKLPVSWRKS